MEKVLISAALLLAGCAHRYHSDPLPRCEVYVPQSQFRPGPCRFDVTQPGCGCQMPPICRTASRPGVDWPSRADGQCAIEDAPWSKR